MNLHDPIWNTEPSSSQLEGQASTEEDYTAALHAALSEQRCTASSSDLIARSMTNLAFPSSWCSSPRLYYIFWKSRRLDLLLKLSDAGITDLWLPLNKRLVRKWLNDQDTRAFLKNQEFALDEKIPANLQGRHFALYDMDQLDLSKVRYLGAGGFGEVHHVRNRRNAQAYACKVMARPVRYDAHVDLMQNFKREVMGMRRVSHQHCVDLVASCTDMDSVAILSSPVADMDLAVFLNADLEEPQLEVLRHAIGCTTSALAYIHSLKIRHDDLKPNNILIRGTNILLTDFGFCLDSTDTGITTTAGPPTHSTRRYSAPEVFDHGRRNRLTDIWSLGCVLADIVSRVFGYKLDHLKAFWLSKGSKFDSYAENPDATASWLTFLASQAPNPDWLWLVSFIRHILLERNRLRRPSAEKVYTRLSIAHAIYTPFQSQRWIGPCCRQAASSAKHAPRPVMFWSYIEPKITSQLDVLGGQRHFETIFLDRNLSVLASNDYLGLNEDITPLLGGEKDFLDLCGAVTVLNFRCNETYCEQPKMDFDAYVKSLYICCDGMTETVTQRLFLKFRSEAARIFTTHTVLATMQFEGEKGSGTGHLFLALCFDPNEGEDFHTGDGPWAPLRPGSNHRTASDSPPLPEVLVSQVRSLPPNGSFLHPDPWELRPANSR